MGISINRKNTQSADFCNEDNSIKIYREQVFKIEINQVWKGEIPNFINILIINNRFAELKKYVVKKKFIKKIMEAQL